MPRIIYKLMKALWVEMFLLKEDLRYECTVLSTLCRYILFENVPKCKLTCILFTILSLSEWDSLFFCFSFRCTRLLGRSGYFNWGSKKWKCGNTLWNTCRSSGKVRYCFIDLIPLLYVENREIKRDFFTVNMLLFLFLKLWWGLSHDGNPIVANPTLIVLSKID